MFKIQEHAAKTAQMVEDLKVRMDSLQKDKDAITAELYEQKRHFLEKVLSKNCWILFDNSIIFD